MRSGRRRSGGAHTCPLPRLARIEGGAPGAILEIGEDYVLVRETGEYDVELVRMYRLEGPG
jgi:hypothetical protein